MTKCLSHYPLKIFVISFFLWQTRLFRCHPNYPSHYPLEKNKIRSLIGRLTGLFSSGSACFPFFCRPLLHWKTHYEHKVLCFHLQNESLFLCNYCQYVPSKHSDRHFYIWELLFHYERLTGKIRWDSISNFLLEYDF